MENNNVKETGETISSEVKFAGETEEDKKIFITANSDWERDQQIGIEAANILEMLAIIKLDKGYSDEDFKEILQMIIANASSGLKSSITESNIETTPEEESIPPITFEEYRLLTKQERLEMFPDIITKEIWSIEDIFKAVDRDIENILRLPSKLANQKVFDIGNQNILIDVIRFRKDDLQSNIYERYFKQLTPINKVLYNNYLPVYDTLEDRDVMSLYINDPTKFCQCYMGEPMKLIKYIKYLPQDDIKYLFLYNPYPNQLEDFGQYLSTTRQYQENDLMLYKSILSNRKVSVAKGFYSQVDTNTSDLSAQSYITAILFRYGKDMEFTNIIDNWSINNLIRYMVDMNHIFGVHYIMNNLAKNILIDTHINPDRYLMNYLSSDNYKTAKYIKHFANSKLTKIPSVVIDQVKELYQVFGIN